MKNILITGGSGFIGTHLTHALLDRGYSVIVASRHVPRLPVERVRYVTCDVTYADLPAELDGTVDAVMHLAGKNIFGRWTKKFQQDIYDSRILGTRRIVTTIARWQRRPSVLISASAYGYYGDTGESEVNESHPPGTDFLATVCRDWERESSIAATHGIRSVQIRTALVLGGAGMLKTLMEPFRYGLGAWIGDGTAWFPWIHVDDIVGTYIHALENETISGPVNACAPEQVRQKEFMRTLAKQMHTRARFSIPSTLLRLRYGALADTFTASVKLIPERLHAANFQYRYPTLPQALRSIV